MINHGANIERTHRLEYRCKFAPALAAFTLLFAFGCHDALPLDSTGLEQVRSLAGAHWDSVDSRHFRLYTEPGTWAARHIATLRDRVERARTDDLALLGMWWYPHRIHVFYFASKARMDSVFGEPGEGQADPPGQLVMLLADSGRYEKPDDAHEIMHVISITRWGWGARNQAWMIEGLANFASASDWPYTIDQMAAQSRHNGDQRGPAELTGDHFLDGDRPAHFRAYMLAGSFVGFLGVDKLRQLWQRGLPPAEMATLTARWNDHLRTVALPSQGIDLVHVMQCICP
jgi:hypothetical protein